uniref:Golgin subfamily A member 2-like n=1 Tax=Castor canadensis TaxID=51338 RepID=A0A8B7TT92_CASCN
MSEETRQHKLAVGKKILLEHQQKRNPGAKKKNKSQNGSKTTTAKDCHSFEDILKVPVSDLNEAALPSLESGRRPKTTRPLHHLQMVSSMSSTSVMTSQKYADNGPNIEDKTKTFSTAESLLQLSRGSASIPSANQKGLTSDVKNLESQYHRLVTALDSSHLTNNQLRKELEELKKEHQEIVNQLKKEKKQCQQELEEERRTLKQQLQDHVRTIGILVAEKANFQTALAHAQQTVRQKEAECEDLTRRLRPSEPLMDEMKSQLPPQPPAGPSEANQLLQAEAQQSPKELEDLTAQLRAEQQENERLSRLNQEQGERLRALEREAEVWNQQAENRKKILETIDKDLTNTSRALLQNSQLKEQLAELQGGFNALTNKNTELTSALHGEQHINTQLTKQVGQLQDVLGKLKDMVEGKTQEARGLQQQKDQCLAHLQQCAAAYQQHLGAYQQLTSDKEDLHRQLLKHTQLLEQLQQGEIQGKMALEMALRELKETQERLEVTSLQNQQLQAQLSLVAQPEEEDEVVEQNDEAASKSTLATPQDLDSALAPGSRGDYLFVKRHQITQVAMDKLQKCFLKVMQEKVDLKERVKELEHKCVLLSGETDTIGDYIALYHRQRAVLRKRYEQKEEYVRQLTQDKEDLKLKLVELQKQVIRLEGKHNKGEGTLLTAAESTSGPWELEDTTEQDSFLE